MAGLLGAGGRGFPSAAGAAWAALGVARPRGVHSAVEQSPARRKGRGGSGIWRKHGCCHAATATATKTHRARGTRRGGDGAPGLGSLGGGEAAAP